MRSGTERPNPAFREFVLKIHGRCDLACNHCYVYTMADQRWRTRPAAMAIDTLERTADRIAEHAQAHQLSQVDVVLHGGEPLLYGGPRISRLVAIMRAAVGLGVRVNVHMQTNGVLLDAEMLALCQEIDIRVGVSLDGDQVAHDRHRVRHDGRGSYYDVVHALTLLGEHPEVFGGLLCTIDLRNDPITTFESLLRFRPPAVDFLLPQANWAHPPPRPGGADAAYACWLTTIFDRWYPKPTTTRIRLFDEIIHVALGGRSALDGIGPDRPATVVVETDGSIKYSDMLTATFEGAGETGLNVTDNPFDDALPWAVPPRSATACVRCAVFQICGGGLVTHRFDARNGFDNPSVYCVDLYRLITHVRDRVRQDVARLRASVS